MAKHTEPITYVYEFEGRTIEVTRRYAGSAYAANGNAHNPTDYFTWSSTLDGLPVIHRTQTRAAAYEYARAKALGIPYTYDPDAAARKFVNHWRAQNVRNFVVVRKEMTANYRGRKVAVDA